MLFAFDTIQPGANLACQRRLAGHRSSSAFEDKHAVPPFECIDDRGAWERPQRMNAEYSDFDLVLFTQAIRCNSRRFDGGALCQ